MISADACNQITHACTLLALTTKIKPSQLALTLAKHVTGTESQVLPWQIMTISENRLKGYIATLDEIYMAQVERSLKTL